MTTQTASGINNDYMKVECKDEVKAYHELGRVHGNGWINQLQAYLFLDDSPLNGNNHDGLRLVNLSFI